MEILVNGKIKGLSIIDPKTGCDWVQDLIGNADGFDGFDEEKEMPKMEQNTYDWWSDYIDIEQDLGDRIEKMNSKLDHEDFEKFQGELQEIGNDDFEAMQNGRLYIVEDWEKRLAAN